MATISTYVESVRGAGGPNRAPYIVERIVDFAAEGVNQSTADVLQVLTIPANTMILTAGLEMTEVAVQASAATDATVSLGTDTDADEWVATFDIDGASVGDYAPVAAAATAQIDGVANTLDLTFAGTDASFTAGKARVFAILMDVDAVGGGAAEVDRDQLA